MSVLRIGSGSPRIAVVQAEGPEGFHDLRAGVGVVPFVRDGEKFLTVVVRLDLALRGDDGALLASARATTPAALWCDRPLASAAGAPADPSSGILEYASDFALTKTALDVLVVGHARAEAPAATIEGSVELVQGGDAGGGASAAFVGLFSARAGQPAPAIPLRAPYLYVGGAVSRLHPSASPDRFVNGSMLHVAPDAFQAADAPWRAALGAIDPGATLRLRGLFGVAEARIALPGLEPIVTADVAGVEGLAVPVALDTLWLDADAGAGVLVWRGVIPIVAIEDIDRLVISLERRGTRRESRLSDTQRGSVRYAWTEDDAREGKPPPGGDDVVLEYHRYRTWAEVSPEPRVPIEEYAQISAELAERPKDRAKVLARRGYDENRWMVEERCWLERFATDAVEGKSELAAHFGTLFLAAQDGLTTPQEEQRDLRDYAGLRADMAGSADPSTTLERANITLAEFMRLERRWLQKADEDPAVMAELESLLAELGADRSPLDGFDPNMADDGDEDE